MILTQVARLAARFDELTNQMADPAVAADFSRLNELDRERNEIEEIAQTYRRYQEAARQLADNHCSWPTATTRFACWPSWRSSNWKPKLLRWKTRCA
jgi:protein subunit release factor A